jgi:hypothetical protein
MPAKTRAFLVMLEEACCARVRQQEAGRVV